MRHNYDAHGVDGYYESYGASYKNPHDAPLRKSLSQALDKWYKSFSLSFSNTLDLACGSGESTLAIEHWCNKRGIDEKDVTIAGADPYTHEAYKQRVGREAQQFSFSDIQAGHLEGRRYSTVISSFALHLLTDKSQLWATMLQLSFATNHLIVMTPHKRPELEEKMGFQLLDEVRAERIRVRLYKSTNFPQHAWTHPHAQATPDNTQPDDNKSSSAKLTLRQRLRMFWEIHAPEKIANIDRVLKNYESNPRVLIDRLEKKYKAQFPAEEVAPSSENSSSEASAKADQGDSRDGGNEAGVPPLPAPPPQSRDGVAAAPLSHVDCSADENCESQDVVQKLHGILFPPHTSTANAHELSDAERRANQSLAVKSLTYGEIRIDSFYHLLCKRVLGCHAPATPWYSQWSEHGAKSSPRLNFMDLGSGTGAAVFAAALCFPFHQCSGIEVRLGREHCEAHL